VEQTTSETESTTEEAPLDEAAADGDAALEQEPEPVIRPIPVLGFGVYEAQTGRPIPVTIQDEVIANCYDKDKFALQMQTMIEGDYGQTVIHFNARSQLSYDWFNSSATFDQYELGLRIGEESPFWVSNMTNTGYGCSKTAFTPDTVATSNLMYHLIGKQLAVSEYINGTRIDSDPVSCNIGFMNPYFAVNETWFCHATRNATLLEENWVNTTALIANETEEFLAAGQNSTDSDTVTNKTDTSDIDES